MAGKGVWLTKSMSGSVDMDFFAGNHHPAGKVDRGHGVGLCHSAQYASSLLRPGAIRDAMIFNAISCPLHD